MIAYLDASVVLRVVFAESGVLPAWPTITAAVASRLLEVECLRTIDRARLAHGLPDRQIAALRQRALHILSGVEMIDVSAPVLARAGEPMSTSLGTLDAIHLATALLWRDQGQRAFAFATHDEALALAARAHGFDVVGA